MRPFLFNVSSQSSSAVIAVVAAALIALAAALRLALVVAASAVAADRIGQHFYGFHRRRRIVAFDDEFAGPRTFIERVILKHERQTGPGRNGRREGTVQQLPLPALAFESHARNIQRTLADIADEDRPIRAATGLHAAKGRRT